jgi:large subunit ribosomal protein L41e
MWNRGNIQKKERMELASPASSLCLFLRSVWSESVPTMAHKSNPYKKSRAKFRWKWKKKRTRRLQRKRRQMRQRSK